MIAPASDSKRELNEVVVIDTNVLLADPNVILSFPRAEVVIPETVLGELDKLKTARVDPDLRFRGREVSRLLFEFSEEGSLVDGVDLPDGGRLRVAPFESDSDLPEGLATRNADDRILATAIQVCRASRDECVVRLVTNDLNMLLKAQTFGVSVSRHGQGVEGGFARRYIIRPFQRYKVPIGILAIALGVFAAVLVIVFLARQPISGEAAIPTEFQDLLTPAQSRALQALTVLESNPNEQDSLLTMANYYSDQVTRAQANSDQVSAIEFSRKGITYYQRYLTENPENDDARADLATLLFYSGQTDKAIQALGPVLENDPDHINANFNLGIFYWQGRRDLNAAKAQMRKVIRLTENDQQQHANLEQARLVLQQIEQEERASGEATETGASTQ